VPALFGGHVAEGFGSVQHAVFFGVCADVGGILRDKGVGEAVKLGDFGGHGVMCLGFGVGSGCDRSTQDGADFATAAGDSGRDVTDVVGADAVSVVPATTARSGADVYSAVLPDADGASCFGEGGGDFGDVHGA